MAGDLSAAESASRSRRPWVATTTGIARLEPERIEREPPLDIGAGSRHLAMRSAGARKRSPGSPCRLRAGQGSPRRRGGAANDKADRLAHGLEEEIDGAAARAARLVKLDAVEVDRRHDVFPGLDRIRRAAFGRQCRKRGALDGTLNAAAADKAVEHCHRR